MQDSVFIIFIVFGFIWVLMGVVGLIALFKSEGQEIRFEKSGLIVFLPIIIPIAIVLLYQVVRTFILQ
ncbi:hypothetical protein [Dendronalium sp. ChiSLP03b]|uniref:hypothetical protein n=1 Tax=Dendronalium sp. ChiSLP03b TaxID=3075381 RepID=UPI002AD2D2BF|nr:hypothetical protein [Dendronalium sp. ChiSLP03b]MDZ8204522.1 hypothetical protein [Dendronalium sp. ChiSLP03b]